MKLVHVQRLDSEPPDCRTHKAVSPGLPYQDEDFLGFFNPLGHSFPCQLCVLPILNAFGTSRPGPTLGAVPLNPGMVEICANTSNPLAVGGQAPERKTDDGRRISFRHAAPEASLTNTEAPPKPPWTRPGERQHQSQNSCRAFCRGLNTRLTRRRIRYRSGFAELYNL